MAYRFYVPPDQIGEGRVNLAEDQRKQIKNVLRLRAGDMISVFDGTGAEYDVALEASSSGIESRITGMRQLHTEPHIKLTLVQSVPKGEKMEFILQKGTEVGVSRFMLITTSRSVPSISPDKLPNRLNRWRTIVKEAAEQSGRARIPAVEGIFSLEDAIIRVKDCSRKLIAWEEERKTLLMPLMPDLMQAEDIALFIGPEGGFSSSEVSSASDAGITPVSLGPRILRTETAAIVASALIVYGEM